MAALSDVNPGSVRASLTKNTVTFAEDQTAIHRASQSCKANKLSRETRTPFGDRDMEWRKSQVKVTYHPSEQEGMVASERHYMPPLLGYDWIAGVLDTESSLTERSEEFFDELRSFRSINKDQCVSSQPARFLDEGPSAPLLVKDGPESNVNTHQCTFCYRINSRLFPVPLDPQECCPVCKRPKSTIPHTTAEPAFIRVSMPHSTLLPAYKYKAHRRRSFDPSDSLGLPSAGRIWARHLYHAPAVWIYGAVLTTLLGAGREQQDETLRIRGYLCVKGVRLSALYHQNTAVSRLAAYSFQQHLLPNRKPRDTSFNAYQ